MNWIDFCNAEWMRDYNPDEDDVAIALILAMKYGDWQSVQALLPIQPDVNARDGNGDWTLLMYAVHEESLDTVKMLVEAGADVNLRGSFEPEEDFALNLAAHACHQEIFDYLAPLTLPDMRTTAEINLNRRD
jgi:ankyrin repeat protein